MELAGVALAIVPLITTAVASYADIRNSIRRYRGFSDEVEELFAELNVQCTIFRTAVQLLFASFVGAEEAAHMMADEQHSKWDDPDLKSFLDARFENRLSAVMDSILLLRNRLIALQGLCDSFRFIVEDAYKDDVLSVKKRARRIRKKLSLACSQSRVEVLIKSVKERTQDFRVLVQQSERIAEKTSTASPSRSVQIKVARSAAIKLAADDLYEAFSKVCTKHIEHKGYIGLEPSHNGREQVSFTLALKGLAALKVSDAEQSSSILWMTIESGIHDTDRSPNAEGLLRALNGATKRSRPSDTIGVEDSVYVNSGNSRIRNPGELSIFNSSQTNDILQKIEKPIDTESTKPPTTAVRGSPTTSGNPLPNLCDQDNFCNLVQKAFRNSAEIPDKCVGFLQHGTNSKHLLYFNFYKNISIIFPDDFEPLSKLISTSSTSRIRTIQLSHRDQFSIAKQLSRALLQFRSTKWLQDSWTSNDIMIRRPGDIYGYDSRFQEVSCPQAYATMSIRISNQNDSSASEKPSPYIRNRPMFNLAKMLLELAYQKPFDQLLEERDLHVDPRADPDYAAADRLRYSVSAKVGLEYGEIVRKCIECDFGQGNDLSQEGLQASFYHHVIEELEKWEAKSRHISIA